MPTLTVILNLIQQYMTIILGVLLVVGVIGNILNCSVFLRKRLRSNACSVYFAASSIANTTVLIYYIIPTMYSTYNPPLENADRIYCKLRLYIRNALLVISRTYLTLACASCYAQSSRNVHIRKFCQSNIVLRVILIVPFIWFIIPIHIPILTDLQNGKCSMWTGGATLYHSLYICFVAAILPTTLMIIFSLLAYNNLRQMIRNVYPQTGSEHHESYVQSAEKCRLQQRDRQLSKMLFVQVIVYMIFTISYPIQTVYNAVTLIIGGTKSQDRLAIENFTLFLTSGFLLNFYSAASFFVFLTSNAFRRELRQVFAVILSPCLVIKY